MIVVRAELASTTKPPEGSRPSMAHAREFIVADDPKNGITGCVARMEWDPAFGLTVWGHDNEGGLTAPKVIPTAALLSVTPAVGWEPGTRETKRRGRPRKAVE